QTNWFTRGKPSEVISPVAIGNGAEVTGQLGKSVVIPGGQTGHAVFTLVICQCFDRLAFSGNNHLHAHHLRTFLDGSVFAVADHSYQSSVQSRAGFSIGEPAQIREVFICLRNVRGSSADVCVELVVVLAAVRVNK